MNANEITREDWLQSCFPEWGTWLLEQIDDTVVKKGSFAMWWLGCCGLWVKSEGNTNIIMDLYSGNSKTSHYTIPENQKGSFKYPPCIVVAVLSFALYAFFNFSCVALIAIGAVCGIAVCEYYERKA